MSPKMGIFDVLGSLDFFSHFPQTIQIACLLVIIFHISYKQAIPTWYYSLEKLTFLVSSSLISISGKQGDYNYKFLHSQEATETFAKKIDVHLAPVGQDDWKSRCSRELECHKCGVVSMIEIQFRTQKILIETTPHFRHSNSLEHLLFLTYWSQMDTNLLGECFCGFLSVKECIIIIPLFSRYAHQRARHQKCQFFQGKIPCYSNLLI